jgi:hypothetical protein
MKKNPQITPNKKLHPSPVLLIFLLALTVFFISSCKKRSTPQNNTKKPITNTTKPVTKEKKEQVISHKKNEVKIEEKETKQELSKIKIVEKPQKEEAPKRWWRWHGGKYWKPNTLDDKYRIENAFHGQALIIQNGIIKTQQFQGPVPEYQQRIFFEKIDNNGNYKIYVKNKDAKIYLTAAPDKKQVQVIEIQEINVYNSKDKNLINSKTIASQSSVLSGNAAYAADKAIDKKEETFSHTQNSEYSWFELDLGKTYKDISKITINIRPWLCIRLKDADVIIKDSKNKTVWKETLTVKTPKYIVKPPKPVSGRYIRIEHDYRKDKSIYVYGTEKPEGDKSEWQIIQTDSIGYYKIINKATGKVLQAPKHMGLDVLAEAPFPVKLVDDSKNNLTKRWTIEPVCDLARDILAVSEIGWVPEAPQKWGYLVRKEKLSTLPEWSLTDTKTKKIILKGKAIYGGYMFRFNYYIINLTPLKTSGVYWLDCDGDRTEVYIAKDAYVNFRHRGGSDRTIFADMLDGKGFIGYWAHNDLWNHIEYIDNPFFKIRDFKTNKDTCTKEKITQKYLGGWDHTDRWSSAIQPISETLRQLVFTYDITKDKNLKTHLINEMKYGIKYLLNIQNKDGSWPFAVWCANKTTGTTAAVSGALALSYKIIKTKNSALAKRISQASLQGWKWVEKHPDNWVDIKETYRHGWAEEKMMLALELYFITKSKKFKEIAFEMIRNSKINSKRIWVKQSGKFKGQAPNSRGTQQALITMMRHYNKLPNDIQVIVMKQWEDYYALLIKMHKDTGSVFGFWEQQTGGYGSNSPWVRNANFLYRLYKISPTKHTKGFYLAEHVMDWIFGANPFASSLVYGFGNRFLSESWARPYVKGSILPGLAVYFKDGKWSPDMDLTPSLQAYGNGESETSSGVVMIQCLLLREELRKEYPPAAQLPSKPILKK